uniref:hypothetical protein n=1 Tax=Massilia sp. METH4 TaxID=3123041 RepID=UPI00403F81A4
MDHDFYVTTSIQRFITRRSDLPLLEGLALRNKAFAERGAQPPGDPDRGAGLPLTGRPPHKRLALCYTARRFR